MELAAKTDNQTEGNDTDDEEKNSRPSTPDNGQDSLLQADDANAEKENFLSKHDKNNITVSGIVIPANQELSVIEVPRTSRASIQSPTNASSSMKSWLKKQFAEPCGCSNNLVVKLSSAVVILLLLWGVLYTLVKQEVAPGGGLFQLIVLVLLGYIAGQIVKIVKLPPLLGMLITGIVLKTAGFITVSGVYVNIVITLREVALSVILIKAGLGLDPAALVRLSLVVLRLACCPCLAEALGAAVVSHYILNFPWVWGLLVGFMLSAVSPAVVVPTLLKLKEQGYGRDKGISTLVIAASSLDDVIAITLFGVFLSMVFSTGDIMTQILQGPVDLIIGLISGIVWGLLAGCLPHRDDNLVVYKRAVMLGGGGLCAVLGSELLHVPGAGPLACITSAFVAGICWKLQGWPSEKNPVQCIFSVAWHVLQPVLFGLIGAEIDLNVIQWDTVAYGLCVIAGGLVVRVISCCVSVLGGNLNFKEIMFVNLAWLPKATVQAALAPEALDMVRREPNPEEEDLIRGSQILTIAVLSILITAPVGAIGLSLAGPRFLTKDPPRPSKNAVIEKL